MDHADRDDRRQGYWRKFLLRMSAAAVLLVLAFYSFLLWRTGEVFEGQMLARAQAGVEALTLARRWNANHGAVYVERKPEMQPNSYLDLPEVAAADGRAFLPIHPAQMTREISEYAQDERLFVFHLSSLKPLNPRNAPDDFERTALTAFEQGARDYHQTLRQADRVSFRYMAPLAMEAGCLPCHEKQGYKLGDIRGGVSIRFDISDVASVLHFKQVNDLHGHQVGDLALRQVGGVLKAACRAHDTLARYGGEELALIVPEIDAPGLMALGEKLLRQVRDTPVYTGRAEPLRLTISLGLVCLGPAELALADEDQLIRLADQALYRAKQEGRDRAAMA